ncbi:MAP3K7 C-terminal isoform X3 [Paramuricea clavata]|uniref:MAP3K7 C-terminal isoform X3 n=1 Tax=Paramuricea clavata TaxID=317549 RepID=A0A7D9EAX1_PARCT|nr:MAP3K7 C-terminal isoform X3 [Paramuricea clavata]
MASEIDDPNVSDGSNKAIEVKNSNVAHEIHSPNTAHESSAFTKVAPSKQSWPTREVGEIPKVEDIPLFMPAPEGAVGYTSDIPELIYRDEKTSEMLNALEDNTESFEIQSEILNNTDTINIPQQNHTHGSASPVSGNIPPHNTPVIGSNIGEINLQDVRLALTAFNDELADDHVDNGHDFRRSFSADVYHEDREHGMRLRHHSDVTLPTIRDDMVYVSGLDPQLQPVPPISGSQESVELFDKHIKLAKDFLELRKEIDRQLKRRSELDRELEKYEIEQRSSAKNIEDFSVLTSEQETLKFLRDELLEKMQRYT